MPEFQRQKHRSLTDEQLYEEYHRSDERKKKSKSGSTAKKVSTSAGRSPSVSPGQPKKQETQPDKPNRTPPKKKPAPPPQKKTVPPKQKTAPTKKKPASSKKKPQPKPQPRKKRGKMTLYYLLIGIVAVATVSVLSVTVLFNISSFHVVGDTAYSDEEIIAACGIEEGDNLLRINIGSAEEQIVSKLVYIDSAKISRGFPNRLVITVEPAKPAVSFAFGGSFYVISERRRLLQIDKTTVDCPVVKGFSPGKDAVIGSQLEDDDEGRMDIALHMIDYMQQYGLKDHCEINLSDTLNIMLIYDNRVEMELGANTRLEDKIYHAGILLKDEISASERCTLILSNPDRVVKRPVYDSDDDDSLSEGPDEAPPEEAPPEEAPPEGATPEGDPENTEDPENFAEPEG